MDCPDCQVPLATSFYEGVRIRFCKQCHGSLLGANDLTAIIERHEEDVDRSEGVRAQNEPQAPRNCPGCKEQMVHETFMNTVVIDRCTGCQRVWLDPHELEDIQFLAEIGHGETH